jgi:two-component system CheB/CheR fusion protein
VKLKVVSVPSLEKVHTITAPGDYEARPLRILIVDDNRDSARTLARVLEFDGHTASCIFDGLAVTEAVVSFRPDFVLLDIGLPGLDGFQVAQQLRRSFSKQELTLVAVTGYGEERDHALAKLAGFDHFLVKPLNLGVLQSLLAAREIQSVNSG